MVVAQLVERCIWDAEVVGSSPAYHTIFLYLDMMQLVATVFWRHDVGSSNLSIQTKC